VYSSNAFAILGLRALYFFLSGMLDKFHYLSKGLAIILGFIGVKLILQASHKMISTSIPEIPSLVSLAVIVVVLAGSVVLSLRNPGAETVAEVQEKDENDERWPDSVRETDSSTWHRPIA
jgi:tellurite resistance protein TerC